jgi:hypothetical protein
MKLNRTLRDRFETTKNAQLVLKTAEVNAQSQILDGRAQLDHQMNRAQKRLEPLRSYENKEKA